MNINSELTTLTSTDNKLVATIASITICLIIIISTLFTYYAKFKNETKSNFANTDKNIADITKHHNEEIKNLKATYDKTIEDLKVKYEGLIKSLQDENAKLKQRVVELEKQIQKPTT